MLIVLDLSTLSSIYLRYVPQIDVKTWRLKLSLSSMVCTYLHLNEGIKDSGSMPINRPKYTYKSVWTFLHHLCNSLIMRFFRGNKKHINGEQSVYWL